MRASGSVTLAVALAASAAAAQHAEPIARGTAGAVPVPFVAENAGPAPMSCSASIAHWFSADLGQADPGASVTATLWFDPTDGKVFILNETEHRMAIEALWCGLAGRSWATRSAVPLARHVGAVPAPIRLTCAAEQERLTCR